MPPAEDTCVEVPAPLNDEEKIRLCQLEGVIEQSLQSFLVVGRCLIEVRDRKLYRHNYATFQDYCTRRWGISERRGLDLVRATGVAEVLLAGPAGPNGDAPLPPDLSETALRPLAKLPQPLQAECWRLAARLGKPTNFVVRKVVRIISNAIEEGTNGNGHKPKPKPKRQEAQETRFWRSVFILARACPDAEIFVCHFGEDHAQAARALGACRQLSARCDAISQALLRRFPELEEQCKYHSERIASVV